MNHTPLNEPPELAQLGARIGQLAWPDARTDVEGGDRLLAVRRAAGAVTVIGTLVQVVVWMLIAVFTGGLDRPWWLIYLAAGATAILALWLVDTHRNDTREARR